MIGLDTNVLARFLLQDDAVQTRQAKAIMDKLSDRHPGFISHIVLVELAWMLKYVFQLSKDDVLDLFGKLGGSSALRLENHVVVLNAMQLWSGSTAEFSDCLIACVARQAGCSVTLTFDRKAAKVPGMKLAARR
ncbi:PIN domain-containing protein [Oxalobacteraceae bacterium A2-2]